MGCTNFNVEISLLYQNGKLITVLCADIINLRKKRPLGLQRFIRSSMSIATTILSLTEVSSQLYFSFSLKSGKFVYLNPAMKSLFNIDTEIHYSAMLNFVHTEDKERLQIYLRQCIAGKVIHNEEVRFVINRNEYWLGISAALVGDEPDGAFLTGTAENISAVKAYIGNLQQHNTKKNAILNILSHDLAGPIGIIENISSILEREAGKWNDHKIDQYIAVINKTSKSCINLIRDFVNQEFIESTTVKLFKTRTDLVYRLREVISEYQKTQEELGITFIFKSSLESLYIDLDEDKFLQVIHNLISNAMKFTPQGGRVLITLEEGEKSAILVIQDNGIGIPKRYHSTLFDKFTRARRTGLHGEQSTGLGMSIIKTIIDWHDGTISFRSVENEGTAFYINLPK